MRNKNRIKPRRMRQSSRRKPLNLAEPLMPTRFVHTSALDIKYRRIWP